jgi:hypothetical protein
MHYSAWTPSTLPIAINRLTASQGRDKFDEIRLPRSTCLCKPRCVLMVVNTTPRTPAVSGAPPTSTVANNTRSSVGVNLNALPMTSKADGTTNSPF